jgi:hypothetical protein
MPDDPEEDLVARELFRRAGTLLADYWPPVLAALTGAIVLSGLSYFHGYLGTLGFSGLASSLSPATYLLYGSIAALLGLTTQLLIVAVFLPIVARAASDSTLHPKLAKLREACRKTAPGAAVAVVVIFAAVPWQWLHPGLGNILVMFPRSEWRSSSPPRLFYTSSLSLDFAGAGSGCSPLRPCSLASQA